MFDKNIFDEQVSLIATKSLIRPQKTPVFREFRRTAANGGKVELNIEVVFD